MKNYLSKRGMAYVTVAAIIVISAIIITSVYYSVFKGTQGIASEDEDTPPQ